MSAPPEPPSRWRQIQQAVHDLEAVQVTTRLDGASPLRIESTHHLLLGDVDTQIDAPLLRPERAFVRAQHLRDLDVSSAVRQQWVSLFRGWARLDEALEETD